MKGITKITVLDYIIAFSILCPHQDLQLAAFFMKIHLLSAPVGLYAFFSLSGLHSIIRKSIRMEATCLQAGCLIQL